MILVDTGPLVALFDPKDPSHSVGEHGVRLSYLDCLSRRLGVIEGGSGSGLALRQVVIPRSHCGSAASFLVESVEIRDQA